MKYLFIAIALVFLQTACAADSTKVKNIKRIKGETVNIEAKKGSEKVKKSKDKDSTKVATSPSVPLAKLYTDIIPSPLSINVVEGRFTINEKTAIICDKGLEQASNYLSQYIPTLRTNGKKGNSIRLILDNKLGKEEYTLCINNKGIELRGGDYGGVFNGIQSLLQLLPHAIYTKNIALPVDVSHITIKDAPEYHYRGLLLDVVRTFQPVHEVKRVIDYMAYCKLNKLHLHLTDSEGWRVEIKQYPHLTQEGGYRGGDSKLHPVYGRFNSTHGGYYTQEELRDIVEYAAIRNIEVIPELDMPGHSKALGMIHPAIRCNYTPNTSNSNGIDIRDVWCVAKEENYTLIDNIINELTTIFPSEYIHIGGDEVMFSQWKSCSDCNKLMTTKGLTNYEQLEQYFLNRVSDILIKHNRKAVVWDEAADGGLLPKSTMVTGWRGIKQCLSTTAQGYSTIIMPSEVFYLDKRQSPKERGHLSSKGVSLKSICDFSFNNAGFSTEQRKCIAGIEAAFWSEIYLFNINPKGHFSDYLEYMLFPRLFGVAEVAWSKQRRSYDDMMKVLKSNFYYKLQAMSATFRLEPPTLKIENGKIFASTNDGSKLYYKDIRTNKSEEFKAPLNADMAPFVTFQSRLMTGYSNDTGLPAFYANSAPKCEITSSIPFSQKRTAELCASYRGPAYTTRAAKSGDWVEFRLEAPVRASYIKVVTGYEHLHRCLIYNGHIEVCYDGKTFTRAGNLYNGSLVLRPKRRAIHSLRIVADGISDAENKIVIQPLIIK